MKYGLIVVAISMLALAGRADAAPRHSGPLSVRDSSAKPPPRLNFRLVRDPDTAADPVRHSGMIAQTEVAPNATLGFGILRATRKGLGPGEWRLDPGEVHSRKAAVSFDFRF